MKLLLICSLLLSSALHAANVSTEAADVRLTIRNGLSVLNASGPVFVRKSGCVSCHHQALPMMATAEARKKGIPIDDRVARQQKEAVLAAIKPARELLLEGSDVVPDVPVSFGYALMGLAADGYAPDGVTAAVVHNIALRQREDGSFTGWAPRPPIEYGDIRATVIALRGMALYAPPGRKAEFDGRIARAGAWLAAARPATPEENIMRLLGLIWAKANPAVIRPVAAAVLAAQRPDGGWAQLDTLPSDAYATGEALVALHESGLLNPASRQYQAGIQFLMRTKSADGTWRVATRSFAFQPLLDTGFPHGRDQWISASATGWALLALLKTVPQ